MNFYEMLAHKRKELYLTRTVFVFYPRANCNRTINVNDWKKLFWRKHLNYRYHFSCGSESYLRNNNKTLHRFNVSRSLSAALYRDINMCALLKPETPSNGETRKMKEKCFRRKTRLTYQVSTLWRHKLLFVKHLNENNNIISSHNLHKRIIYAYMWCINAAEAFRSLMLVFIIRLAQHKLQHYGQLTDPLQII